MPQRKVRRRRKAPPMSLAMLGVLERRRDEFARRFGRPPLRGEPLLFDPAADIPTRLPPEARRTALAWMMQLAGMPEHLVADFVAGY